MYNYDNPETGCTFATIQRLAVGCNYLEAGFTAVTILRLAVQL